MSSISFTATMHLRSTTTHLRSATSVRRLATTPRRSQFLVLALLLTLVASLAGFIPQSTSLAFPDVFGVFQSGCGGVAIPC